MKNRSFYFLFFCVLSFMFFLTTLLSMVKKEDDLTAFQADLDLFVYAVNIIGNKVSYKAEGVEFIKFLIKDKKFYKKFRERIAEYAQRFKGLRDGKIKELFLGRDSEKEILEINCKIQKRYEKWEEQKEQDEKVKRKKEKQEEIRRKEESKRIESEFERANIEFAGAKAKFVEAKKKYSQALSDVKKEKEEIRRKREGRRIELEFEKANIEFAEAKARFSDSVKVYRQALRDVKSKK